MIAGFIFLRLRGILGKRTGFEGKAPPQFKEVLKNIKVEQQKDLKDTFDEEEQKDFLKGAEIAYETILTAFAKGEVKKLKSLLTSKMNENFSGAIDARNKENIKSEFTFIGIKESSVEKYEKVKDDLFASVKFVAEVISVKKDKDNNIIEGSPDKIKFVTDIWKFTKNIKNNSPNWYLAEIISQ